MDIAQLGVRIDSRTFPKFLGGIFWIPNELATVGGCALTPGVSLWSQKKYDISDQ